MGSANLIVVVGSSNTDMVIRTAHFPVPGETILGGQFFMFPGGKGANQAVAAARLGGHVSFIAKVGNDIFGQQAIQQFQQEGIDSKWIITDPKLPSGVALITVDDHAENTIVVAQGSNATLSPDDVEAADVALTNASILLTQLETPLDTVMYVAQRARALKKRLILNPAPARQLPAELFQDLYLITPNETETEALTGIAIKDLGAAKNAAVLLREKGVSHIVITLGAEGSFIFDDDGGQHVKAPKVKAVDTTAAGDVFNGALAVAISEGSSLIEAVEFANHAAALSVTKMGAQASAPYRKDLKGFLTTS